ncbi:uncharacterized protein N0V89_007028 [Didymosphaeria variabile]|uniref:FAD-binding PCMH-type domain-containing protein n=1 Tax=Didymosphaeria variabile TaxID=1932322 RepID=A0A9W9C9T3_9PLEO|nr:uncharacterized protein N0V89_007028 [Didymosphaeria variabile]KAJ4351685.1 hypothetical protein N0V89_007028 [Didymosphaeria variabile]
MLIDVRHVNREVVYDLETEVVSFGPAVTGAEISEKMLSVGRFFPHGHTPSVAVGGFLLAGGQGWFFRSWGLTAEMWVLKMEVTQLKLHLKRGTDITFGTFYPEKYDPKRISDEIQDSSTLVMAASVVAYTNSLEQVAWLMAAFSDSRLPEHLISAVKPMLCNLPTRQSAGCLVAAHICPSEINMAGSLPQEYYIAAMCCWTDPDKDNVMHEKLRHVNEVAKSVACGLYVADFNTKWPVSKVMPDSAFTRFTEIRQKWDPEESFQGYRGLNNEVQNTDQ